MKHIKPSGKPVKKSLGWYEESINEYYSSLNDEQRVLAKKVKTLCKEAIENGVIHDKHVHNGYPLPDGYVYKFDFLLNEIHDLYYMIGINYDSNNS